MKKFYNFAPGPATLPSEVVEQIQAELFNWNGTHISPLEIGHRSYEFQNLLDQLKQKITHVLDVPKNYKILFLQGGAQTQFSAIPMNLCVNNKVANYFATGIWSQKAVNYAKKYATPNIVTTASNLTIPNQSTWVVEHNAAYTYYCTNETVNSIYFPEIPNIDGNIPLIADATSSIFSLPIDISKHGLVFASAQKNIGIAGVTLVIIRDDLLDLALDITPETLNYKLQFENNSCVNTAPTFPIYVMDLMLNWILKQGGVNQLYNETLNKANKIYQAIDYNQLYTNKVDPTYRSPISISFGLTNYELVPEFLEEAQRFGLLNITGHNLGDHIRVCVYNAMPMDGVDLLVEFMEKFAKAH